MVDVLTARAQMAAGLFQEAAAALEDAAACQPDSAALLSDLGYARTALGQFDQAIDAYRHALSLKPDFAEAHFRLGSVLSENGHVAEGFAHYMRHAALVHGTGKRPAAPMSEPEHKRKHDREQRAYLDGQGESGTFQVANGDRLAGPRGEPHQCHACPAGEMAQQLAADGGDG